jgi:hypothetical protein
VELCVRECMFTSIASFPHFSRCLNSHLVGCPLIFVFKHRILETSTRVERIDPIEKNRGHAS